MAHTIFIMQSLSYKILDLYTIFTITPLTDEITSSNKLYYNKKMLIATFNVNSIRSRLPIVLEWLKAKRPDILCLQETKVQDADFPAHAIEEQGYRVIFKGEKSYNGVAIISKEKPEKFTFGFKDGLPTDETRLIYAKYADLHIFNTYVPQGREITHEMYKYKIKWFERLLNLFSKKFKPSDKILWVGDLNIAPEAIDIHNAEQQQDHVCFHIDVRNAFKKVISWGFIDLFRKFHPSERKYTFFDYRTKNALEKNMGWRVDHILATEPIANLCKKCEIDLAPRKLPKASDHTILFADFEM